MLRTHTLSQNLFDLLRTLPIFAYFSHFVLPIYPLPSIKGYFECNTAWRRELLAWHAFQIERIKFNYNFSVAVAEQQQLAHTQPQPDTHTHIDSQRVNSFVQCAFVRVVPLSGAINEK